MNMVHRDVKPSHFLIGLGQNENLVYLIDFAHVEMYYNQSTDAHISFRKGISFEGDATYCSINRHLGFLHSRRDDLESLAYIIIYFLKGSLPWQDIKADKLDQILKMKDSVMNGYFFDGLYGNILLI
jgi:serine/threonine protein kinase